VFAQVGGKLARLLASHHQSIPSHRLAQVGGKLAAGALFPTDGMERMGLVRERKERVSE
jgi:hypothetical protein